MEKISTFLLSVFTPKERYGRDVNSFYRRYRNLSLIYVNIGITTKILIFRFSTLVFFDIPFAYLVFLACMTLSLFSFYSLRQKSTKMATIWLLIEMHVSNLIISYTTDCPLETLYGVMMWPFFIFLLTPQ